MHRNTMKIGIAILLVSLFFIYSFNLYFNMPIEVSQNTEQIVKGKKVWQKNNCNSCHQLYGLGGYLGTDLTNIYSLRGPEHIRIFIANGTVTMPSFKMNKEETEALIAFLKHTDESGKANPKTFRINPDGTIQQAIQ